jgi:hypothetical protein
VHGTENTKGRYMTKKDLLDYKLTRDGDKFDGDRVLSARVGGAKKVSLRLDAPEIMKIKTALSSGEKRYYLTPEAIPALEQLVEMYNEDYREHLDGHDFFYPGEEEE